MTLNGPLSVRVERLDRLEFTNGAEPSNPVSQLSSVLATFSKPCRRRSTCATQMLSSSPTTVVLQSCVAALPRRATRTRSIAVLISCSV